MLGIQIKQEQNVSNGPENNIYIYEEFQVKQEINTSEEFDEPINEQLNKDSVSKTHDFMSVIMLHCEKCNEMNKLMERAIHQCRQCKDKMTYVCQACKTRCQKYRYIVNHVKFQCKGTEYYYCNYCGHRCKCKCSMKDHIYSQHLGGRLLLKCQNCNMTYTGKKNLQRHQKICGLPPHLLCTFCSHKTKYKKNLVNHIDKHHTDKFNSQKNFHIIINKIIEKGHILKENSIDARESDMEVVVKLNWTYYASNLTNMYCTNCDQLQATVPKQRYKKMDCTKCKAPLIFECKKCKNKFGSYKSMYQHIVYTCYPRKLFRCDNCDYKASKKRNVSKHMRSKHSIIDTKEYNICSIFNIGKWTKSYCSRYEKIRNWKKRCIKCETCKQDLPVWKM